MSTWLLLDTNYLCYRAFHSLGDLSFGAIKTGVVFGVMRDVLNLQERFGTECVAFCFDVGLPLRRQLLETYKQKRHSGANRTEEEERARAHVRAQIEALREDYLPSVGYRNVFGQQGFEADDIIASICRQLPEEDDAIIVTADTDLYQLLSANVSIFTPPNLHAKGKYITLQSFKRDHGITPKQWVHVKALAGCPTDEVPGVPGCGNKTAIKYILGTLKDTTKIYRRVASERAHALVLKNWPLVKLPFKDTPTFTLQPDEVTDKGWTALCDRLGMESLRHLRPMTGRASRRGSFGLRPDA